jgi:hypothetical protein
MAHFKRSKCRRRTRVTMSPHGFLVQSWGNKERVGRHSGGRYSFGTRRRVAEAESRR